MGVALSVSGYWLALLAATATTSPERWLGYLTRGGLLGGALLLIYALLTDRLVSGPRHRREILSRDREIQVWRAAALRSGDALERIADAFAAGDR